MNSKIRKNNAVQKEEKLPCNSAAMMKNISKEMVIGLIKAQSSIPEETIEQVLTELEKYLLEQYKNGDTMYWGSLPVEIRLKNEFD